MKRILIVEDNRLERKLINHLLQSAFGRNILVDEAVDGAIALQMVGQSNYNLLITDLIMPNMEGLELIRKIRYEYSPELSIIAISGSKPYYLYLAKKMGVQGVFTKPLDTFKFTETVQNLLCIMPVVSHQGID